MEDFDETELNTNYEGGKAAQEEEEYDNPKGG
jgi:hypothetical protein